MSSQQVGARAALSVLASFCLAGCGGSTPSSPTPVPCAAIAGPTTTTLRAGEQFRYRFTVPSGSDADVLVTFMAELADVGSDSAISVRLYDGAKLLGAAEDHHDSVVPFKSPQSLFGTPSSPYSLNGLAIVVDFSSIANGTIDGRVEYIVSRGSVFAEHLEKAAIMLVGQSDQEDFHTAIITARELCR